MKTFGLFDGSDPVGRLLMGREWKTSPLGEPATWSPTLITLAGVVLGSEQPMLLAWGDELVVIYNAAYAALIGDDHPAALGRPLFDPAQASRDSDEPHFRRALRGEAARVDIVVPVERLRYGGPVHIAASYTPVREGKRVVGVLCLWTEVQGHAPGLTLQAFRLELERRLRDLAAPRDVMQAAAEMLGQHVRANWAGYAEVETDGEHFVIERDWSDGGVASVVGRYRLSAFGAPLVDALQGGSTVTLEDAYQDTRTREEGVVATFAALGVRASVGVPLVKCGRLAAVMFVACVGSREWSAAEVALANDVAERTWAQVERARAEAAVRQNARELRLVADAMPGLIAFIDKSLTYRFANRTYELWFGTPPEEVVGRTVREVVGVAGEALRRPFMDRALAGEAVLFEATWPYADGRTRTVDIRYEPRFDADGIVDGFHAFVIDVTERTDVEHKLRDLNAGLERMVAERTAQLRAEEARLRAVFETSYQLQVLLDPGGMLLAANAAALAAIGGDAPGVVGLAFWLTPWFAATAGLPEVIRDHVGRAAAGETVRLELELDLPAGRRSFDFALRPVRRPDGDLTGILAEAADTTDHRLAEERLRQSQRMEAVGQLTGGVAHDFNNLLTVLRSSADLLRRPGIDEARRRRYADAIVDTVDRAAKLTGQLLAFARRQTLKPEVFDAGAAVAALDDMLATLTGSSIRVTFSRPDQPCLVDADPSQFDTAIVNLVANARDAILDGGRIGIAVSESTTRPGDGSAASGTVSVSVADSGTGMPPEQIGRIFEPFFTTKEPGKGTGLGLAMVYGFVKQSGGDVTVESTVGQGTTVTLHLPRATGPVRRETRAGPQPTVDGNGARVLVVEDNVDVGWSTASMLNEIGYRTMLARNADEALSLLARDPTGVDVVFSDVLMPGMDGLELAEEIGRRHAGLPVILTSGYSHALAQGGSRGFELLQKPYSLEQLSRTLADSVQRATRHP